MAGWCCRYILHGLDKRKLRELVVTVCIIQFLN